MVEAAKYNPGTWSQTWALLSASELAPVVALNTPPREVVPGQEYAKPFGCGQPRPLFSHQFL